MSNEKILLLGFGDIAQRLAQKLAASSTDTYSITGVKRSPMKYPKVDIVQTDIADPAAMETLLQKGFDIIVVTLTPSEISDEGYRQAYVATSRNLLSTLEKQSDKKPRLILFVSSTSVYGQANNEWVDERSDTEARSYSGQRLLEAENLYKQSDIKHCIVRFSGIYGPGRQRLIEQVINGNGTAKEPVLYSNRIHADDCAAVLMHLIEKQKTAGIDELYLASDCEPTPLYEVKQWLAEQLQLPKDHLQPKPLGRSLRSSKRCNNKRLLESGYQFTYPNFKAGYSAVLQEFAHESKH